MRVTKRGRVGAMCFSTSLGHNFPAENFPLALIVTSPQKQNNFACLHLSGQRRDQSSLSDLQSMFFNEYNTT